MARGRATRIASELKKEMSDILQNELKDPRVKGIPSITGVEVSRDLRHAKFFISVFGSKDDKEQTFKALEKAKGFIRTEIGQRIRLRHTPEIHFEEDHSLEYGARISEVLRKLEKGQEE
ncbi:MAG: 30S ribosome-binding factor RbfA [Dethiobacteria bacterium]|jgi:ribosome-binding factor A|nr:30S ribosome-binding factor RbfA [Bacillota bacterium]